MEIPEIDKYLEFCIDGGAVPRFKGFEPFEYLYGQGRIRELSVS